MIPCHCLNLLYPPTSLSFVAFSYQQVSCRVRKIVFKRRDPDRAVMIVIVSQFEIVFQEQSTQNHLDDIRSHESTRTAILPMTKVQGGTAGCGELMSMCLSRLLTKAVKAQSIKLIGIWYVVVLDGDDGELDLCSGWQEQSIAQEHVEFDFAFVAH